MFGDKQKKTLVKKEENDNSDDELDVEKLEQAMKKKSSFNHMTWRIPSMKLAPTLPSSVIVYFNPAIMVMIKVWLSNGSWGLVNYNPTWHFYRNFVSSNICL